MGAAWIGLQKGVSGISANVKYLILVTVFLGIIDSSLTCHRKVEYHHVYKHKGKGNGWGWGNGWGDGGYTVVVEKGKGHKGHGHGGGGGGGYGNGWGWGGGGGGGGGKKGHKKGHGHGGGGHGGYGGGGWGWGGGGYGGGHGKGHGHDKGYGGGHGGGGHEKGYGGGHGGGGHDKAYGHSGGHGGGHGHGKGGHGHGKGHGGGGHGKGHGHGKGYGGGHSGHGYGRAYGYSEPYPNTEYTNNFPKSIKPEESQISTHNLNEYSDMSNFQEPLSSPSSDKIKNGVTIFKDIFDHPELIPTSLDGESKETNFDLKVKEPSMEDGFVADVPDDNDKPKMSRGRVRTKKKKQWNSDPFADSSIFTTIGKENVFPT